MKMLHLLKTSAVVVTTMACLSAAQGAISVGPTGSGVLAFGTQPTTNDGWSTIGPAGASADIGDAGTLALRVNTNDAAHIAVTNLGSSTTTPPSANAICRWNGTRFNLQTLPTGVGYTVLMATLQ